MGSAVLVVEDEQEIRELLRHYLERAAYGVLTTGTGAEAVRLLGELGIDPTLLDLGLPGVDGDEVLRPVSTGGCRWWC
ncbi:response regulator [Streptomyces sp. NPDC101225]|uniref:response regulator n=1 Tax=Streptomyces sp. NPDC101225 TaxID=3366135 RepID=UPI00382BA396